MIVTILLYWLKLLSDQDDEVGHITTFLYWLKHLPEQDQKSHVTWYMSCDSCQFGIYLFFDIELMNIQMMIIVWGIRDKVIQYTSTKAVRWLFIFNWFFRPCLLCIFILYRGINYPALCSNSFILSGM